MKEESENDIMQTIEFISLVTIPALTVSGLVVEFQSLANEDLVDLTDDLEEVAQ